MTEDGSSQSTCINIIANDVRLDCNGFTIAYGLDGLGNSFGVNITGKGASVSNCNISMPAAGHGIRVASTAEDVIIFNNNITRSVSDGTTSYGIYASSLSAAHWMPGASTISGNNINMNGSSYGIYLVGCEDTWAYQNNIVVGNTSSTPQSYGIFAQSSTGRLRIYQNNISVYGVGGYGIFGMSNTGASFMRITSRRMGGMDTG